ncbi:putative peptidyl-tRNA hydrolase PTRHD1 [Watersipora subatra]|uniref:putative peptidyl-tRNA hydrolase PTRHD1 n=1 Tax=Watersipora subatra TaxID=2589382 RepID=UPI00355BB641
MATLLQYVVVRKDLITMLKWPVGAVIAQACHACAATMVLYSDDELTKAYTTDLDNMHKCVLEIDNEEKLQELSKRLEQENILHKLWIEQPENYPTCLVTKPYKKEQVQPFFKKLKLFK